MGMYPAKKIGSWSTKNDVLKPKKHQNTMVEPASWGVAIGTWVNLSIWSWFLLEAYTKPGVSRKSWRVNRRSVQRRAVVGMTAPANVPQVHALLLRWESLLWWSKFKKINWYQLNLWWQLTIKKGDMQLDDWSCILKRALVLVVQSSHPKVASGRHMAALLWSMDV